MTRRETVGSIIDDEFASMVEDWKRLRRQWQEVERQLSYLENQMDDFWSNWLAPLDDGDRAGVWDKPKLMDAER